MVKQVRLVSFFFLILFQIFLPKVFSEEDPLFIGPLILDASENYDKGSVFVSPLLFFIRTWGQTTESWKTESIDSIFSLQGELDIGIGITNWLDIEANFFYFYNKQLDNTATELGDFSIQLGFQLLRDKEFFPNVRLLVGQIFPTGKFENLNPELNALEAVGAGTFETFITLILGKEYYWLKNHPMKFTTNFLYSFPQVVDVKEFNSYGGGFGTEGRVDPGNTFLAGVIYEILISKHLNFLTEFIYTFQKKTPFSGDSGIDIDGEIATVAQPRNQGLSISPNIEINVNESLYFTVGGWFNAISQNQDAFASAFFSMGYTF